MINQLSEAWLKTGLKYEYSKWRSGQSWSVPALSALARIGISYGVVTTPHAALQPLLGGRDGLRYARQYLDHQHRGGLLPRPESTTART